MMYAPSSLPSLIRFACSLLACCVAAPVAAQDEALVDVLADVLAAQDARDLSVPLTAAADHPDALVRRHVALAAGRIGDPAGLPILVRLSADPDSGVSATAVFALGLVRDARGIEVLSRTLLDRSAPPSVRREAITALAKIATPAAREVIDGYLASAARGEVETGEFAYALGEMWRLGAESPTQLLVRHAESSANDVRRSAVYALARLRATEGAGVFIGGLNDDDVVVRGFAARTLDAEFARRAGLQPAPIVEALRRALADTDTGVRINAIRSLATFRDPATLPEMITAARDRRAGIAQVALAALGDVGGEGALTVLEEFVEGGRFALREQALLSMARLDRARGLRKAAGWIQSSDWLLRLTGARALAIIAGDTARAWLRDLVDDADGRVAAAALSGLARVDSLWGVDRARRALAHVDIGVRARAASLLGQYGFGSDGELLVGAYALAERDADSDARLEVLRALHRVTERGRDERVIADFFRRFPSSADYLARREASELFRSLGAWGPVFPVVTGRSKEDYRQVVRRLVLPAERGRRPQWELDTERGRITVELFAADAPLTVSHLIELSERQYFDGGRWHRVVPNFVIQDGDPRGDGTGGPGVTLRDEINRHRYGRGFVGMALSGPDTGGSQFFITHAPQPHLDGTYTIFGRVTSGMTSVDEIAQGDRMRSVRVRR